VIIGFERATVTATSLAGGVNSPVWLSATEELYDSNPQSTSRVALDDDVGASPTVDMSGAVIHVRSQFAEVRRFRLIGLLGLSVTNGPSPPLVTLALRRPVDVAHTYFPAGLSRPIQLATLGDESQTSSIWWLLPEDMDFVNSVQLSIWNYTSPDGQLPSDDPLTYPGAGYSAETYFDIGEIASLRAVDVPIQEGFEQQVVDPTVTRRTLSSRISRVSRTPYRALNGSLPANTTAVQRHSGLPDDMDWVKLERRLLQSKDCAVAFQDKRNLSFNQAELNLNCFLAACTPGATRHVQGQYYSKSLRFEELPT
jgi:hypothetical protein